MKELTYCLCVKDSVELIFNSKTFTLDYKGTEENEKGGFWYNFLHPNIIKIIDNGDELSFKGFVLNAQNVQNFMGNFIINDKKFTLTREVK